MLLRLRRGMHSGDRPARGRRQSYAVDHLAQPNGRRRQPESQRRLGSVHDQDKTMVSNANFVSPDAAYGAPLCVPAGSTHVRAFLDDNEDEDPNAVTSSDYLDSCASGSAQCFRCFDLNVSAGATADLTIYLAHTCD